MQLVFSEMKKKHPEIKYFLALIFLFPLIFINGYARDGKIYGANIEDFSGIISLEKSDLERIFGNSSVFLDKIPSHDPGDYESGLGIQINNNSIFLRMEYGYVKGVLFRSPVFKTQRNVYVGQSFCDVSAIYPKAEFYIGYNDELLLIDKDKGLIFDFIIGDLPYGYYMENGLPNRDSPTLCIATLDTIELVDKEE